MKPSKPRTLHFAVGGALLAVGSLVTPVDAGCALPGVDSHGAAFDEPAAAAPLRAAEVGREPVPLVVNPGPIAPPLPLVAEPSGGPIVVNPGPVPTPDPGR